MKMYGRAEVYLNISEAVGHRLLNAEGQVHSQGSPHGSYGSQNSNETDFPPSTLVFGWDSSVGIVTGYGLDGPGIESRWGRDFLHTSRPALGPTQPPVQWILGLSRG
jgi:hypothetical protein